MGAQSPNNSTLTRPTFNTDAPADNTAAVITLAADVDTVHVVDHVTCCYDAAPIADSTLTVAIGGSTKWQMDITGAGPQQFDFSACPFESGYNETLVITLPIAGAKATETLTLAANAVNNETVTLDSKTYTFKTAITGGDNVDGNVKVGTDAEGSIDNLVAAITLGDTAGTNYAANMTLHPTVTAAKASASTMLVTAKTAGTAGNSIASTEAMTQGSFTDTSLSGGTDVAGQVNCNSR